MRKRKLTSILVHRKLFRIYDMDVRIPTTAKLAAVIRWLDERIRMSEVYQEFSGTLTLLPIVAMNKITVVKTLNLDNIMASTRLKSSLIVPKLTVWGIACNFQTLTQPHL
jgi:hypothetical protein